MSFTAGHTFALSALVGAAVGGAIVFAMVCAAKPKIIDYVHTEIPRRLTAQLTSGLSGATAVIGTEVIAPIAAIDAAIVATALDQYLPGPRTRAATLPF